MPEDSTAGQTGPGTVTPPQGPGPSTSVANPGSTRGTGSGSMGRPMPTK